jgi:D-glucosaminate-6-phosphate ammonia-lyase
MTMVFDLLKIAPIVNAAGSITPHSGSPIDPDITLAMATVAQTCVDIADLQGRASEIIAECTGAEAGMVTSGASAALLLGAAACMAGLDAVRMGRLPDTAGMRNEFLVPHSHRNSYDHAVRAAGARLVEVGVADRLVGVGVRDTEAWEVEGAITAQTAGILYVARPDSRPALSLVVAVAHKANLPVLVDAAAELPPASNLRRFIAEGADLVAFSGGKALGGPSGSGILCGRRRLVASALLQQLDLDYEFDAWQPPPHIIDKSELACVPRNGIGRSCKAGKEQIVGLLLALLRFAATDDDARRQTWLTIAHSLVAALDHLPALRVRLTSDADGRGVPLVEVSIQEEAWGLNAAAVAAKLRCATPSVRVDAARAHAGILTLVPTCLRSGDAELIGRAFAQAMKH